jgi:hypothetical protein
MRQQRRTLSCAKPCCPDGRNTVFARISPVSQDAETVERFATLVRKLSQVVECHIMAGESEQEMRAEAQYLQRDGATHDRLKSIANVGAGSAMHRRVRSEQRYVLFGKKQ